MRISVTIVLLGLLLSACAKTFYYENGEVVKVTKIDKNRAKGDSGVSHYMTSKGHEVGVNDEVIVECVEGVDCLAVLAGHGLEDVSHLTDTLLLVKLQEGQDVFEVSQELYEDGSIRLAHPNFIKTKKRR